MNSGEIREITDNGQKGFFISREYWTQIRIELTGYQLLQEKYKLLEENYNILNDINIRLKKEIKFSQVKNITIAVLAGISLTMTIIAIVIPVMRYNFQLAYQ